MKQEGTLDAIGTTSVDDIRRRYAKERFLAFMAEKFWNELLEKEKAPHQRQPVQD
ncbi:hypothetical protein [Aedoeadaptatus coli]|uniref:hypothetical protein n=1 Tax=Aedoeadaptatus coli TaxID=2058292 RepID=UPI00131F0931|nr:hypothetical protein [Peptoniphilus coli]